MKKCSQCGERLLALYFGHEGKVDCCGFCIIRSEKQQASVTELNDSELTDVGLYLKRRKSFKEYVDNATRKMHQESKINE